MMKKFDVEWYIHDFLSWKHYILKYHVDGVWDSLAVQAESITVPNLVLLKLCTDEMDGYIDIHEKAKEIGLPEIIGFQTRVLKIMRCPYIAKIKKALEEKRTFEYSWGSKQNYFAKGYPKDNEFKAWFTMEYEEYNNSHYYFLLDGEHAIWKEG